MSWNKSPLAFEDVRDLLERALNEAHGIKITLATRGEAVVLRSRFNHYRKFNREENKEIYPIGNLLHGRSVYDALILRIPPKGAADENILYIEKRDATDYIVEALSAPIK